MKTTFPAVLLSPVISLPALADRDDRGGDWDRDRGHEVHGAPRPIAGGGFPFLAVGYGVYWLIKRCRKED